MGERERETTSKEGRGRESEKGLPSSGHESSEKKTPSEDTRGDLFMANPALRERVSEKQNAPKEPPSQIAEQVTEKPIFLEALFVREFQRMSAENKRLREENEQLTKYVDTRKEQNRRAAARQREKDREAYNAAVRERRRKRKEERNQ